MLFAVEYKQTTYFKPVVLEADDEYEAEDKVEELAMLGKLEEEPFQADTEVLAVPV